MNGCDKRCYDESGNYIEAFNDIDCESECAGYPMSLPPRNLPQANVKPLLSDVLAEIKTDSDILWEGEEIAKMSDIERVLSKYFA